MTGARARLLGVTATSLAAVAAWPLPLWRFVLIMACTLLAGLAGVLLASSDR